MMNPVLQDANALPERTPPPAPSTNTPSEPAANDLQLRELQILLFGAEQQKLAQLHTEFSDPKKFTPKVSQILPDAIAQRTGEDQALTQAMLPYVIDSIKHAARHNPEYISEAIFPILGPAIRKAIAQAFNNLTQTINQTLQHSFTVRGLRWRMEAMATGKSFAEVVLYHSLLYRVEQVFLIHRKTGILLVHTAAAAVETQDADIVSGMLTAIHDFIKDSFGAGADEGVETMQVGDVNVLVEQGPRAVLACVVRGTVPAELRPEMQTTLERIHREQGAKLESFEGDTTVFETSRPLLENHLQSQYQPFAEPNQTGLSKPALIAGAVLLAILALGAGWIIRERWRWNRWVETLRVTPGIVITETETGWWHYRLQGLRDPLAADPQTLMVAAALSPSRVTAQWEDFHAPALALQRAQKLFNPPSNVTLQIQNGILTVRGAASQQWLSDAKKLAPLIPGIQQVQTDLSDTLIALQKEIESKAIYFLEAQTTLAPQQEQVIENLLRNLESLNTAADQMGKPISVTITGHTDPTGTNAFNQTLGLQRAKAILSRLQIQGNKFPHLAFVTKNQTGEAAVTSNKDAARRVSLSVALNF